MLLTNEQIQTFQKLWNESYKEAITEEQAEEKAQKLLSLIKLVVNNHRKKYEK